MKTVRRLLKWLLMFVAALLIATVGSWWLIADAPVNPEIENLLTKPAPPPADQNAYFLLWGFTATDGLNPHVTGQRIVAEHENLLAAQGDLSDFKPQRYLGAQPLALSLKTRRCEIEEKNCLQYYQSVQADILADTEKFSIALDRYRSLRNYAQFSERVMSSTPLSPFPDYAPVMTMSALIDAQTALLAASAGSRKVAMEMLGAEMRAWRRILQGSDTLVTQMIATAALHRKYRLASEIMHAYPHVVTDYSAQMAAITMPLTTSDFDFGRALEGEFRFTAHLILDMNRQIARTSVEHSTVDKLANPMMAMGAYKQHATLNQAYAMHRENVLVYTRNPSEILSAHTALVAQQAQFNLWSPAVIFYNPIGKVLLGVGTVEYGKYALRLYDLAGYSRLVELQRRIIEAKIAAERIPVMLSNVGLGLMDPYTGQAMAWDPDKRTLSFAGHGGRFLTGGRVTIALGGH